MAEYNPPGRPVMDEPSVFFARLLESIVVEEDIQDRGARSGDMSLVCQLCSEVVCFIDNGDDLRTLLNTALQHRC